MTFFKAVIGSIAVAWILGIAVLEIGSLMSVPGMTGLVPEAEARVGRPLTPVSVAGVARRTVRHCAAGVVC